MVKRHMLRISAPRTWAIKRKEINWVTRPNSGPHKLSNCVPLGLVLKEMLQHAGTSREAKKILQDKNILVNKKIAKSLKEQVGFMDVLEIPKLKEQYRLIFSTRGKLILKPIKATETGIRVCKILGKRTLKNKKTQLNLDNGTNLLVEKDKHTLGDSMILTLPDNKIKEDLKLEKGATVYLTGGKKIGTIGKIESITQGTGIQKGMITVKSKQETFETRKAYAFVIGKDKPAIEIE